jgi:CIC family chloride channel protein
VGWINELLVGPMMRRDPSVIAAGSSLDELRRRFPPGGAQQVFVVDDDGRLCGIIDPLRVSEPTSANLGKLVQDLVAPPAPFLLPVDDLRNAIDRFGQTGEAMLPVVDNPETRRIIGYLSEAYAVRRYAQELESHRGARQDDTGIFSPIREDAGPADTRQNR